VEVTACRRTAWAAKSVDHVSGHVPESVNRAPTRVGLSQDERMVHLTLM
jgi:hypothetical protein